MKKTPVMLSFNRNTYFSVIVLVLMTIEVPLMGQSCSCAGAKLVSSQSIGSVEKGNLVLGLTSNFNSIKDLYTGDKELTNRTSERNTFTNLFEVNYGLNERFSFTGTFTYVRKERITGLQNQTTSQGLTTSGIGDGLVMLKYNILQQTLWEPYHLAIGGGAKIPLASNSLKSNGLPLNADMQPGTGSWDGAGWMFFSYTMRAYDITFFMVNSFKKTTAADRFNENDKYEFGDEINSTLGVSGPAFDNFSYTLRLKYRGAKADMRNGDNMPSTGGEWLNIEPGVSYKISDRFSLQTSGEIPLYRNVNGIQPTTTYILSASLFFSLNKINAGFAPGLPGNRD